MIDVYYSIWPAVIVGAAALGGAAIGAKSQKSSTESANKASQASTREQIYFQREEAEKARTYQTEMSNTAYQRAMADMQKAGLNPMLAFQQGGASTPSSPFPSGSSYQAQVSRHGEVLAEGIPKSVQSGMGAMQIKNFQEQNKLLGEQVDYTASQTLQTNAQAKSLELQTAYKDAIYKTILSNPEMLANAAASEAGSPLPVKYAQSARALLDTPKGKKISEMAANAAKSVYEARTLPNDILNYGRKIWNYGHKIDAKAVQGWKWLKDVTTRGKPIYIPKRKK